MVADHPVVRDQGELTAAFWKSSPGRRGHRGVQEQDVSPNMQTQRTRYATTLLTRVAWNLNPAVAAVRRRAP